MKRAKAATRRLRTYLGRVIRDIERKVLEMPVGLGRLLKICRKIYSQKRNDKNKVYSVHEPKVECISKGKAHKRYEFGVKVSVATTSKGGWFVGALAVPGNPYDGHTLNVTMEQVNRLGCDPLEVFVDQGYRKHDYKGHSKVYIDKRRKGKTPNALWRWMKRRAAVEPSIGHLKQEHRMDRNRLKGVEGDQFNATLSAAGMNLRKLLKFLSFLFYRLLQSLFNNAQRQKYQVAYAS
jgi:IS5 family transposase